MQKTSSLDEENLIGRAEVFTSRLESLIGGDSVSTWAEKHGLNQQSLYNLKGKLPGLNLLLQIQAASGCSMDWLLGISDDMSVAGIRRCGTEGAGEWDEYVRIPLYDVSASAGHGAVIDHETVAKYLVFRRDFLKHELKVNSSGLYCVQVKGESMEPLLRNGHPALIDPSDAEALNEGPYLLRLEGALLLKNLQRMPGGKLRIWSANQAANVYQPIDVDWPPAEGVDLQVLGRVRWSDRVF